MDCDPECPAISKVGWRRIVTTLIISGKSTGRVERLLLENVGTQEEEEKKKIAWIIDEEGVTERQSHCSPPLVVLQPHQDVTLFNRAGFVIG